MHACAATRRRCERALLCAEATSTAPQGSAGARWPGLGVFRRFGGGGAHGQRGAKNRMGGARGRRGAHSQICSHGPMYRGSELVAVRTIPAPRVPRGVRAPPPRPAGFAHRAGRGGRRGASPGPARAHTQTRTQRHRHKRTSRGLRHQTATGCSPLATSCQAAGREPWRPRRGPRAAPPRRET